MQVLAATAKLFLHIANEQFAVCEVKSTKHCQSKSNVYSTFYAWKAYYEIFHMRKGSYIIFGLTEACLFW